MNVVVIIVVSVDVAVMDADVVLLLSMLQLLLPLLSVIKTKSVLKIKQVQFGCLIDAVAVTTMALVVVMVVLIPIRRFNRKNDYRLIFIC